MKPPTHTHQEQSNLYGKTRPRSVVAGFGLIYTSHSHLYINLLISDLTGDNSQSASSCSSDNRKSYLLITGSPSFSQTHLRPT